MRQDKGIWASVLDTFDAADEEGGGECGCRGTLNVTRKGTWYGAGGLRNRGTG